MTRKLTGKEVTANLKTRISHYQTILHTQKIIPTLAIVRVGVKPDDLYYEAGIKKTCTELNINLQICELADTCLQQELNQTILELSVNPQVHGILLFSPLPANFNEQEAREAINPHKDIDCLTSAGAAKVFMGAKDGFPPCTPQAVMEMLKYYQISLQGKKVVIIGRSMVVGKPLAMMMLQENATVTICHSKTTNLRHEVQQADIVVAAIGQAMMIDSSYLNQGQVVIDVGINLHPHHANKFCGDIDYSSAENIVEAITPVPGGIGTVTNTILCLNTAIAALRQHSLAF